MTYSIVARCPETGRYGIAVQTRSFAVGVIVPWVRAGVGAVATQGMGEVSYGYRGLSLMARGLSAQDALAEMLQEDERNQFRQVALIDSQGRTAVHNGKFLIRYAGSVVRDDMVVAANLMRDPGVPEAMAEAWDATSGQPFGLRLLSVLQAGERAGGDLRGRQSAALKISGAEPVEGWDGLEMDIRVDDHPEPVEELGRLVELAMANNDASVGDLRQVQGDEQAARYYWQRCRTALPSSADAAFWHGLMLAKIGDVVGAKQALQRAYELDATWKEVFLRVWEHGYLTFGADEDGDGEGALGGVA